MTQFINGGTFSGMISNGFAALENKKSLINDLNVFPVPDGDTGTNMSLTLGSGVQALTRVSSESISEVSDAAASALLRGARGNSGVILSLLFRGIARALKGAKTADAAVFAAALQNGVKAAYKAVMKPAEGTILTVSRLAADAAAEYARKGKDIDELFCVLLSAGEEALADTVNQNPTLQKAGVVDAGGKGFLCIMDGMARFLQGEIIPLPDGESKGKETAAPADSQEEIRFTYCTELIIRRSGSRPAETLKEFCAGAGDSLVFVEEDGIIKLHVHTNIPGEVITRALGYGDLADIKIENMRLQHEQRAPRPAPPAPLTPPAKYGVVTVCAGDGMESLFKELGADAIVTGGQTMNPSTADILRQVESVNAETVFVFPNNKNIIMAANQCVPLATRKVVVIPTTTVPQGISALLGFDREAGVQECTAQFLETAKHVHTAQITYAVRDSAFDDQQIQAGEYICLLEGSLIANSRDFAALLDKVGRRLAEFTPDVVTLYYGADVTKEEAEKAQQQLSACVPDAEMVLVRGGQPVYSYLISVE